MYTSTIINSDASSHPQDVLTFTLSRVEFHPLSFNATRNISPAPNQDNFHQNSISNVSRLRGTHTISMCPLSKHPQLSSMPTDCVIFVCFLDFKCIEENLLLNPSDRQSILTSYFLIILISYFPSICVQLPRISTFKRLDWWEITTNFKKTRPCHPR